MHFDKALYCPEQALPQARLMSTAGGCWNQIDIGFADDVAIFGPRNHPRCTFAFSKALAVGGGKLFAFKQRNEWFAVRRLCKRLRQVTAQPLIVLPGLALTRFCIGEGDFDAGQ